MVKEIKKIITRKEYLFGLSVFFLASICEYLYASFSVKNAELSTVWSAFFTCVVESAYGSPFEIIFGLFMPIGVSILGSTIAYEEKKQNILPCVYTRQSKRKYIYNQAKAVFVVGFVTIFICLMINLMLSVTTFPVQGHSMKGNNEFELLVEQVDGNWLDNKLDYLHRIHPYAFLIFEICLRSLVAGVFALFAYSVTYLGKNINRIFIVLSPFGLDFSGQLFQYIIKKVFNLNGKACEFFSSSIFSVKNSVQLVAFIITLLCIITLGILCIRKGTFEEDSL